MLMNNLVITDIVNSNVQLLYIIHNYYITLFYYINNIKNYEEKMIIMFNQNIIALCRLVIYY